MVDAQIFPFDTAQWIVASIILVLFIYILIYSAISRGYIEKCQAAGQKQSTGNFVKSGMTALLWTSVAISVITIIVMVIAFVKRNEGKVTVTATMPKLSVQ